MKAKGWRSISGGPNLFFQIPLPPSCESFQQNWLTSARALSKKNGSLQWHNLKRACVVRKFTNAFLFGGFSQVLLKFNEFGSGWRQAPLTLPPDLKFWRDAFGKKLGVFVCMTSNRLALSVAAFNQNFPYSIEVSQFINNNVPMSPTTPPTTLFLTLPYEIIKLIFHDITKRDLINLSTVDRSFRKFLYPYIFNDIYLTWSMIQRIEQLMPFNEYVEQISIMENNSSKEWSFKFDQFFDKFPNLAQISLTLTQSSTPLKYNKLCNSSKVEKLTLQTMTNENSMFGMDHLNLIPNGIKELVLKGFTIQFDREEVDNYQSLKRLTIIDCYWNYPFEFESFDNGCLEYLIIEYFHPFILSERFKEFTNNFHKSFQSLKSLKIVNNTGYKFNLPKTMVLDLKRLQKVEFENIACNIWCIVF